MLARAGFRVINTLMIYEHPFRSGSAVLLVHHHLRTDLLKIHLNFTYFRITSFSVRQSAFPRLRRQRTLAYDLMIRLVSRTFRTDTVNFS